MKKGLFVGLTTVDIFYYVDSFPQQNTKQKAKMQLEAAGGPAANAAVTFAQLGGDAVLLTGLGNHPTTAIAREDLLYHDVEIIDKITHLATPPVLSSVIVDESNGDRTVVYSNTENRRLKTERIPFEFVSDIDVLLVDGFFLEIAVEMAKHAKENGIPVVLDGGSWKEGLEAILPYVDYAICSNNFLPPLCENSDQVIAYLRSIGIDNVCITKGASPMTVVIANTIQTITPEKITCIDSLGAGDIFHGAFCNHILDSNFKDSLIQSSDIATKSCRYRGTRAWIKS